MNFATISTVVVDCPQPRQLAEFYAAVLGGDINDFRGDGSWIDVRRLDVEDIDAAQQRVIALGARPLDLDDGGRRDFRVFADPAGHPVCLIRPT